MTRMARRQVVLQDIDSRIPNLALMKLSAFYKQRGYGVRLARESVRLEADLHLGSAVFHVDRSWKRIASLRAIYGEAIQIGGSGVDLGLRLPPEVDACFPDYSLYGHDRYAVGFLTRGCHKRCAFCVVPAKEGALKSAASSFADFVPPGQRNVMLLDDNLLSFTGVESLLSDMARLRYAVNFSQTLDIAYLSEAKFELLLGVDYRNARFTRKRIYFSCNHPAAVRQFTDRRQMLRAFGEDCVCVVCLYGFDTTLSQDYQRWMMLRRLRLVPFFQEYWPIPGVPSRVPPGFFDMDLDEVIRLTFRSNGQNWEKYLRWLNRRYFATYGRYYLPLVETLYRYNNKAAIRRFLDNPRTLTTRQYRSYLPSGRAGAVGRRASPGGGDPSRILGVP